MASLLTTLLAGLTPPQHVNPAEYDGLEYKWSIFVFRPALFKTEAYLLAAVIAYVVLAFYGSTANKSSIKKWFSAHRHILEQQFSKPSSRSDLVFDGSSDAYNFSTGRRNVTSLHTVFTLKPRHDFFQWIYHFVWTLVDLHYRPKDDVTLDFRLTPTALSDNFVFGVVAKDELLSIKQDRWDLTFTKTTENSALPPSLSVMSEFADITENILKPNLIAALSNPKILPYFRSLTITDQPRARPDAPIPADSRRRHVILSLSLPSGGHVSDTVDLVSAMFPLIDSLNNIKLRPETKAKLKKIRDELDKDLKADAEKEKKEEESQVAEDKKAAKRKAEQERIAKLPAAEQQKILEKERKRALRKSQGKAIVRK